MVLETRRFFAMYPAAEEALRQTASEVMYSCELEDRLAAAQKELEWHRRHLLRLKVRSQLPKDPSGVPTDYLDWDVLFYRAFLQGDATTETMVQLHEGRWPLFKPWRHNSEPHGPKSDSWQAYLEQERRAQ